MSYWEWMKEVHIKALRKTWSVIVGFRQFKVPPIVEFVCGCFLAITLGIWGIAFTKWLLIAVPVGYLMITHGIYRELKPTQGHARGE